MPFKAQDIKAGCSHLQKSDPVIKRLLKNHGAFKAKAKSDRFAVLADSILSQQISTSAANTIIGRLKLGVAQRAKEAKLSTTSLSPEGILLFEIDELRELGVSRQKGTYLLDLAEKVHGGEVNLQNLGRRSDEQVIEELIQVKGIGRWTAQMFLIFSLARMDVLATDDLGLKNAVRKEYELDELPTPATMEEIAVPWRPYATIASWYLWRSLESAKS